MCRVLSFILGSIFGVIVRLSIGFCSSVTDKTHSVAPALRLIFFHIKIKKKKPRTVKTFRKISFFNTINYYKYLS